MTKQEWENEKNIEILIQQVNSLRKRQLFSLASCRSIEHLITDQISKDCLEKLELFIDGKISFEEFKLTRSLTGQRAGAVYSTHNISSAYWAADCVYLACNNEWVSWSSCLAFANTTNNAERQLELRKYQITKQIEFLREIYNPFIENIIFCNEAKSIAQQVYDGDNDARLILSDFLEENKFPEELYLHLKQLTHLKGCWVIDQILEKS